MKIGLTSVSFRKMSCDEVIKLAKEAKVDGIEWGSDVHVPQGDVEYAKEVAKKTKNAGLEVISYGSYFYLGENDDFLPYVASAKALGTDCIRIWGGKKEKWQLSDDEYALLIDETKKICSLAEEEGVTVSLEFHQHSITANAIDAVQFIKDVSCGNLKLYWQEIIGRNFEDNYADLQLVLPYLTNVHVFNYIEGKQELLSDGDAKSRFSAYFKEVGKLFGEHAFMTEFTKGGLPENFLKDAEVLVEISKE